MKRDEYKAWCILFFIVWLIAGPRSKVVMKLERDFYRGFYEGAIGGRL